MLLLKPRSLRRNTRPVPFGNLTTADQDQPMSRADGWSLPPLAPTPHTAATMLPSATHGPDPAFHIGHDLCSRIDGTDWSNPVEVAVILESLEEYGAISPCNLDTGSNVRAGRDSESAGSSVRQGWLQSDSAARHGHADKAPIRELLIDTSQSKSRGLA